ncbi:MAG: iron chelate uptake ABC transporter family permease subunit [Sinomonas sp.]|nr:iron chelate uptake ABC transporter family permease subunit [Sinomonas sp.]
MPVSTLTSPAPPAPAAPARPRASRRWLWVVGCAVVLAVATALSLMVGARAVEPSAVWSALAAPDPGNGDHAVVLSRVPRTLAGILVGTSLGLAGAVMQGATRNPLADPGVLGINAGAAFAVVVGIHAFGLSTLPGFIWCAFTGALAASLAVYAVGSLGRGGATPVKLAIAGAALNAGLGSLLSVVLLGSSETLERFRFWQVGGIAGRGLDQLAAAAPFATVGVVLALGLARPLNGLALGDDLARGLGIRVGASRAAATGAAVLLCGTATAVAGPIGFVGLVVPHLVRHLVGGDYRWLVTTTALLGPALVLAADVVGRVVLLPGEVPAGIMTALVGAPVFVALVRARKGTRL